MSSRILISILLYLIPCNFLNAQNTEVNYSFDSMLYVSSHAVSTDGQELYLTVYPYNQVAIYHASSGILRGKLMIQPSFYKSEIYLDEILDQIIVFGSSSVEVFDRRSHMLLQSISVPFGAATHFTPKTHEVWIMENERFRIINLLDKSESAIKCDLDKASMFRVSSDGQRIFVKEEESLLILDRSGKQEKVRIGPFADFDPGDNFIAFKHLTSDYEVSFSLRSFSGELIKANFRPPNVYGFGKIKAFENESFFYNDFTQLKEITKEGNAYQYPFRNKISDFTLLPKKGYAIQYEKSVAIVDYEGQMLFQADARAIMSTANHVNGDEVVLINDSLFVQINAINRSVEQIKLPSLFVNEISARDQHVAFGLANGDVCIWDMNKRKLIQTIRHGSGCIHLLKMHDKRNEILVTSQKYDAIAVYDPMTSKLIQELPINGHFVTSIDSKNDLIIAGFSNGEYSVWQFDGTSYKLKKENVSQYQDAITSACIMGGDALVGSRGRMVQISLIDSLDENKVFAGHTSYINAIETSTDEKYAISSSVDGSVLLWDYQNEQLLETIQLDSGWVSSMTLDDSLNMIGYGPGIISAAFSNTEIYKELTNPQPRLVPQVANASAGRKLCFSPDGTLLANTDDQKVIVRDVRTGFLISSYVSSTGIVNDITFSSDGNSIIVANGKGVNLFDPFTGKQKRAVEWETMNRSIHQVLLYPNSNVYFAVNVHGWSPPLGFHINSNERLYTLNFNLQQQEDRNIIDLIFSDDAKRYATYGNNFIKSFYIGDNNIKQEFVWPNPNPGIYNEYWNDLMDYDDSGELLAFTVFSSPNEVRVINVTTGELIFESIGKLAHFGRGKQLVYMNTNESLVLIDLDTKKELFFESVNNHGSLISNITYDKVSNVFASTDIWGNQKIWDPSTGKPVVEIERFDSYTYSTRLRDDLKYMMYSSKQGLFLFDYEKLKTTDLPGDNYPFTGVFHPFKDIAYIRKNSDILEYHLLTGSNKVLYKAEEDEEQSSIVAISPDGSYLLCKQDQSNQTFLIFLNDEMKKRSIAPNLKHFFTLSFSSMSDDGKTLYFTALTADTNRKEIGLAPMMYTIADGKFKEINTFRTFPARDEYDQIPFRTKMNTRISEITSDGRTHIYLEDYQITIKDLQNGRTISSKRYYDIQEGEISDDQKLYILAHEDGMITILDLATATELSHFRGCDGKITRISTTKNHLLVHASDNTLNLFDLGSTISKSWSTYFPIGKEYIISNSNGFYSSSPGARNAMAFKMGTQIFPFDQFDLYYNRPDIIAQELGFSSPDKVQSLQKAYAKRLEKMGLQNIQDQREIEIPELEVLNASEIPFLTSETSISFKIKARSARTKLSSIHVWINNNPIYGQDGILLNKNASSVSIDTSLRIDLSCGLNKIQISVVNELGIESYRRQFTVKSSQNEPKPDLYFIGFGISKYADSTMNLTYSDKDVRDISELLSRNQYYENIYLDTFYNESVTPQNLLSTRKRLEGTTIDDHVIFMYSGHGVLDDQLDYYLASYGIDFRNPKKTGIPFESVNALVDGIPARQKLLLIDACHSGELDKNEVQIDPTKTTNVQERETGKGDLFKQLEITGNSFDLMKELFADTRRGTGATIISSSAGKYFSYEDDHFKNGLYTYALREALDGKADSSNNGNIEVSELMDYLYRRVLELSNGRQQPTARQTNLEHNFRVF